MGEFKEAQRIYDNHHIVDRVLKQQIEAAVDKKYLEELSEPLVGYMNISAMDMINHLVDQYGNITSSGVKENKEKMNKPMDIDEPINIYFYCIEKYVQFAEDAKTPYTNEQVLQCVEHAAAMAGMYEHAMEEWIEKPSSSKYYKEFKKFITKKHKYLKDCLRRTAKQQGYHSVSALTTGVYTEEIGEALDNLAMATTAEKRIIDEVQSTNQQLLELKQKMMEKVDQMRDD
eukprot:2107239-Ditylum_brightwellii.AAC.1